MVGATATAIGATTGATVGTTVGATVGTTTGATTGAVTGMAFGATLSLSLSALPTAPTPATALVAATALSSWRTFSRKSDWEFCNKSTTRGTSQSSTTAPFTLTSRSPTFSRPLLCAGPEGAMAATKGPGVPSAAAPSVNPVLPCILGNTIVTSESSLKLARSAVVAVAAAAAVAAAVGTVVVVGGIEGSSI